MLIVPLVFLTLIADYPKIDTNTVFYIIRVGRFNWLLGQILKLIFMAVTYLAVIFFGAVIPMLSKGFWYNGWSNVATGFVKMFPDKRGNFGVQLFRKTFIIRSQFSKLRYKAICLFLHI